MRTRPETPSAAISTSSAPPIGQRSASSIVWFTGPVIVLGLAVIGLSLYEFPGTPNPLGWLSLGALALVAARFALKVPGLDVHVSISDAFFFTSVMIFGAAPATVIIALDSFVISWRRGHGLHQLLFNPASSAIALWGGAQTFYWLAPTGPLVEAAALPGAHTVAPLACLTTVYFILNFGLTSAAVALQKRTSVLRLWGPHIGMMSLSYFAAGSASFFLVVLWKFAGIAAFLVVLPLLSICYVAMRSWLGRLDDAEQHLSSMNRLYLSTIGAFSTAIEAKDGVTSDHIHRVHAYALALSRAMGITDMMALQAIEAAALLHDTGKLAVPEHILNKPGKLTPAEFETMKLHVDVGADILSSIDFPYPVVPIVRAHHENWDGTGYPAGLRGEAIPIGARIVSVVDCYDAMTSDRPYRCAMTQEHALEMIVARRGTMYDPAVVDCFVRVVRDIPPLAAQRPELQKAVSSIKRAHSAHALPNAARPRHPRDTPTGRPEDELLAFVSLARLVTTAPSVQDVGTVAWEHLRHMAPDASLALYTIDVGRGSIVAAFTAGPSGPLLAEHTMRIGERVSGWVAANSQPMLNAEAVLDLPPERRAADLQFALALPLVSAAVPIGVMTLYAPQAFSDDRVRRLEMVAPHLAIFVRSAFEVADGRPAGEAGDSKPVRADRSELRVVSPRRSSGQPG